MIKLPRRVRKKRKKQQQTEVQLHLSDYQYPGERQHYWMSLGVVLLIALWIPLLVWWFDRFETFTFQLAYLPGWVLLSVPLVNYLATRPRRQQLKQLGHPAKVFGNNYPRYYQLLTRLSSLAGLKKPPDMYIVDEQAPYIYSIPGGAGTVIATQALREVLEPEEFAALLAHEIGHIKSHHLRLDLAMTYVDNVSPLLKFAFGPVTVWRIVMGSWRDVIEYTADRVSLLLTRTPVALMRAIIKSAAAADEQAELKQEEIEAYLQEAGQVDTDAGQIERYFKISQFIKEQPNMHDRLAEIGEFVSSDEGEAAFAKVSEIIQEIDQQA